MHPLAADIGRDLAAVEAEATMLALAAGQFREDVFGDDEVRRWLTVGGIASGVEKVFSGMERVLRRIASEIDGHVPRDEAWHRSLLTRMAHALPGVREPVLSGETFTALDELRAFRHRERNSSVVELRPDRVIAMAGLTERGFSSFRADIVRFLATVDPASGG